MIDFTARLAGFSRLSRSSRLAVTALLAASVGLVAWKTHAASIVEDAIHPAAAAPAPMQHARGILAEGRVTTYPGGTVVVGSEVGGRLLRVADEKMHVKKGELVAELASDEQRAALAESYARAEEAKADRAFLGNEADRTRSLYGTGTIAFAGLDRADHDRAAAKARYDVAIADSARLKTVVDKAKIFAPIDGTVIERRSEGGETIAPGAPVLVLADLAHLRVEAEIDEFDAARVRVGQEVAIHVEGQEGATFRGKVEEIPDQVVSRRLKPQDPGHPTDTRVLLAKVALLETSPVFLGQRVEVEVMAGKGN